MKTKDLSDLVAIYKSQLEIGDIQVAYTELVKFVMSLKTRFSKSLGDQYAFGSIFQGYLDYTYFYFVNDFYKGRKLKLGLVLNHEKMRFEIWLLGQTKEVQEKYWNMLRHTNWVNSRKIPKYSVFEYVLLDQPDFGDLESLGKQIESSLVQTSDAIFETLCKLDENRKT